MNYLIQDKNDMFYGFGGWSNEYPEAELFDDYDKAVKMADNIRRGRGPVVVANYGYDDEEIVWSAT